MIEKLKLTLQAFLTAAFTIFVFICDRINFRTRCRSHLHRSTFQDQQIPAAYGLRRENIQNKSNQNYTILIVNKQIEALGRINLRLLPK